MKTVVARDIHNKIYQVSIDRLTSRPAVYAVIIKDKKVLLAKTWDGYTLPGGGMLIDESIKEALTREVKEETGFNIAVNNLLHCDESYFQKVHSKKFVHSIMLFYKCSIVGGQETNEFCCGTEPEYMDTPEWIELSKIRDIKMYSTVDLVTIIEMAL